MKMNLRWIAEVVQPSENYNGYCFRVEDIQSGEVIYRTADFNRARQLCVCFNEGQKYKDVAERFQKANEVLSEREREMSRQLRVAKDALKLIAACANAKECGKCKFSCERSGSRECARLALQKMKGKGKVK